MKRYTREEAGSAFPPQRRANLAIDGAKFMSGKDEEMEVAAALASKSGRAHQSEMSSKSCLLSLCVLLRISTRLLAQRNSSKEVTGENFP